MADSDQSGDIRGEIERIRRVSDMLVSGHSNVSEKFDRYALALDCAILALTVWITSVVFVEPRIGLALTPFRIEPPIWIGLLSILTLFLSVVQLRVEWKRKSNGHKRSAEMYSKAKANCRYLLESNKLITRDDAKEVLILYDTSGNWGSPMLEKEFLKQKGKHLTKVAIR